MCVCLYFERKERCSTPEIAGVGFTSCGDKEGTLSEMIVACKDGD